MADAKACPFCGSEYTRELDTPIAGNGGRVYQVQCSECGASGPVVCGYNQADVALMKWNDRILVPEESGS